ncbi:retrovirus-related pol polyprotein from transposon TNT 1-94 [Tanacetum coccineum]
MKKMNEKPGHVRPANGFYDKLNALMFVPQKELSGDQAYWLSANEIASQASKPVKPATPFVHKSRPPSQVLASLQKVNAVFPQFEGIIKERTTQKPDYVSEWCFDYAKQFVEQQLVPFYDHFKKHIQAANDTFFKEVREFEQIFDDLEAEYEQCVLDNKNLTIEKKNLLIRNDCLIAECLEKDICSICIDTSSASNAIFEINKLRQQLQGKDDTIRNLDAQINIMKVLNVGSTEGRKLSLKKRIKNSKANTHSRTAYTEKLSAFTAENTKLKAQVTGTTSSGPSTSETPKVLAPGMYNLGSKYIPPPKRANWVKPTPLPKKRQVSFSEPPRPSLKPTQKPVVHPNKQTNVCVPMSTGVKPTSGASKTVPKRAPRKHSSLPLQFCDGGLEVAFRQHSCHIRNYDMVDLLKGLWTTNLYSISLNDMMSASPVCLLTKASSTKSWLWHRRLNHLNFRTLNELAGKNLLGKSKKASHPLKTENTNTEVLHTLHMDLCGPMRTESINGKKYVLVIVDDYTRFGWVRFLRSKDETPHAIEKFIVKTQRALNATVRFGRTDNGTEFVNKTLNGWFKSVSISHETSVPRSPQQNGIVERRNRTLMELLCISTSFLCETPLFYGLKQ